MFSKLFATTILCLFAAACGGMENDGYDYEGEEPGLESSDDALARGGFGATGGACHVVGGANTGKSGTYDDEGACCGDWGCTECGGSNTGKCADGAATKASWYSSSASTGSFSTARR